MSPETWAVRLIVAGGRELNHEPRSTGVLRLGLLARGPALNFLHGTGAVTAALRLRIYGVYVATHLDPAHTRGPPGRLCRTHLRRTGQAISCSVDQDDYSAAPPQTTAMRPVWLLAQGALGGRHLPRVRQADGS